MSLKVSLSHFIVYSFPFLSRIAAVVTVFLAIERVSVVQTNCETVTREEMKVGWHRFAFLVHFKEKVCPSM